MKDVARLQRRIGQRPVQEIPAAADGDRPGPPAIGAELDKGGRRDGGGMARRGARPGGGDGAAHGRVRDRGGLPHDRDLARRLVQAQGPEHVAEVAEFDLRQQRLQPAKALHRHAVGIHVEADAALGDAEPRDDLRHDGHRILVILEGAAAIEPCRVQEHRFVEPADGHHRLARGRDHDGPVQVLRDGEAGEVMQHLAFVGDDRVDALVGHRRAQAAEPLLVFLAREQRAHGATSQTSRMVSR